LRSYCEARLTASTTFQKVDNLRQLKILIIDQVVVVHSNFIGGLQF